MKVALLAAVLVAVPALAQSKPAESKPTESKPAQKGTTTTGAGQEGMPDMSKVGPWTRKPTNEAQAKKEIQDFYKKDTEIMSKGDFDAMVQTVSFPVYMLTDDEKGVVKGQTFTKDEWVKMMKPMMEGQMKDMKVTHKPNITVLSDALAVVVDEFSMTMGKEKMAGKNLQVMAKIDGQWKIMSSVEAGWGAMSPPEQQKGADAKPASPAGSPTPASTTAPKK
jgi:hypothetical protein